MSVAMHWTYKPQSDGDCLEQGDILLPGHDLSDVLKEVHKWFSDPKYLGFMVLTQTCDLVRRNGQPCKAPYITIAAIRPLRQILLQLLQRQLKPFGNRYFINSDKQRASELLHRILNQNESALALFYLHPESGIGLADEAVVLLRVSIALRSEQHYDALLKARTGGLQPEFAAKLGWLCGNIFSRIAVPDWLETSSRASEAQRLVDELLSGSDPEGPQFIDQRSIEKRLKAGTAPFTEQEVSDLISRSSGKTFKQLALEEIRKLLLENGVESKRLERVVNGLSNSPTFGELVRPGRE